MKRLLGTARGRRSVGGRETGEGGEASGRKSAEAKVEMEVVLCKRGWRCGRWQRRRWCEQDRDSNKIY